MAEGLAAAFASASRTVARHNEAAAPAKVTKDPAAKKPKGGPNHIKVPKGLDPKTMSPRKAVQNVEVSMNCCMFPSCENTLDILLRCDGSGTRLDTNMIRH